MGGRGNGYANTRKGKREDIPIAKQLRSSWEANFARALMVLQEAGCVAWWDYEPWPLKFPGNEEKVRGNKVYWPDFIAVFPIAYEDIGIPAGLYLFEVKGRLKNGGLLTETDLSDLDKASDSASRIKLQRLMRHYPELASKTILIGQREYADFKKQFKAAIPNWES